MYVCNDYCPHVCVTLIVVDGVSNIQPWCILDVSTAPCCIMNTFPIFSVDVNSAFSRSLKESSTDALPSQPALSNRCLHLKLLLLYSIEQFHIRLNVSFMRWQSLCRNDLERSLRCSPAVENNCSVSPPLHTYFNISIDGWHFVSIMLDTKDLLAPSPSHPQLVKISRLKP